MKQEAACTKPSSLDHMAPPIQAALPPDGIWRRGKNYSSVCNHVFEIDAKYKPLKPLGAGAYGVVCSALDKKTNEKVLLGSYNYGQTIDVWSAGCIFAELLGRQPIFPGTCSENQLQCIISVLGTQKEADLEFIQSATARKYVESLPHCRGIPLSSLFPLADPLELDLLEKMLVFDPRKRITAAEALKHPYPEDIYDPTLDCPAQFQVKIDVEEGVKEKVMRKLMWDEVVYSHPELALNRGPCR
ncbi:hypothetical protein CRG98_009614 [Punica granatum]|uniref:Protein kinase domain-containing protein n=1 Tax=Punica granatum TaxID=22663 RepID=A0A2I0KNE3_PUNGR|nr:hypothetical protein CRG98_009614 [Punica granatum]